MRVNSQQFNYVLKQCIRYDRPLYIAGAPGIGKSERIRDFAKRTASLNNMAFIEWNRLTPKEKQALLMMPDERIAQHYILVDIRLSTKEIVDINGMPSLVKEYVRWVVPDVFYLLSKPISGILFFDELPNAATAIMNAAYNMIHDRSVGDLTFSSGIRIISAGNRAEDGAAVTERPAPLKNRFKNVELMPPSPKEWAPWASQNNVHHHVISFVQYSPKALFTPVMDVEEGIDSFPTPRSVAVAGQDLLAEETLGTMTPEQTTLTIAPSVGENWAIEYQAYINNAASVNVEKILDDPRLFKDLTAAQRFFATGAIAEYYKTNKHTNKVISLMSSIDADEAISMFLMVNRSDDQFIKAVNKHTSGQKLLLQVAPYIMGG